MHAGVHSLSLGLIFRPIGLRFSPVVFRFRPAGLRSSVFVFGSSFPTHRCYADLLNSQPRIMHNLIGSLDLGYQLIHLSLTLDGKMIALSVAELKMFSPESENFL